MTSSAEMACINVIEEYEESSYSIFLRHADTCDQIILLIINRPNKSMNIFWPFRFLKATPIQLCKDLITKKNTSRDSCILFGTLFEKIEELDPLHELN